MPIHVCATAAYGNSEAGSNTAGCASATADFAACIGRVARRIRKHRGLTLVMVAQRAGISPSLLSRLETGDVRASLESIIALADALGVRPAVLLQEVGGAERTMERMAEA
jgi:transcriptional regulator with XRE-family HTH domain